jgi:protein-S-isoprenylcysteine O-methyltransferase Ste14
MPFAWIQIALFVAVSAALLYVSRGALRRRGSHGFYRFFAWECMLALILLNLPVWHVDPLAPHQLASWLLLALSAWLPVHAWRRLQAAVRPGAARDDDAALLGFEKTDSLVTDGAFRYIRHPMYTALMLLAWGACLKDIGGPGLALALAATVLLVLTALSDERECIAHFGDAYRAYMRGTRRFVPFLL